MPIYKSAYETKVGRGMDISRPRRELEDLQVSTRIPTMNYGDYMGAAGDEAGKTVGGLITSGTAGELLIRHFSFPMLVNDPLSPGNSPTKILFGDARPYTAASRSEAGRSRIVNTMEFEQLRVLMAAGINWTNKGTQTINNIGQVAAQVYCRWIERVLRKKFALAPMPSLKIRVLAAYFYQCLFLDDKELNESQRRIMAVMACRASGSDYDAYSSMLEGLGMIDGLDEFVGVIKRVVDDAIQLDNLDSGVVIELMMSTWFGHTGRALAAAAIEHPPTFVSMLYMSFGQQGYRKAVLSQISEDFRGHKGGNEFIRNMQLQLGLE